MNKPLLSSSEVALCPSQPREAAPAGFARAGRVLQAGVLAAGVRWSLFFPPSPHTSAEVATAEVCPCADAPTGRKTCWTDEGLGEARRGRQGRTSPPRHTIGLGPLCVACRRQPWPRRAASASHTAGAMAAARLAARHRPRPNSAPQKGGSDSPPAGKGPCGRSPRRGRPADARYLPPGNRSSSRTREVRTAERRNDGPADTECLGIRALHWIN